MFKVNNGPDHVICDCYTVQELRSKWNEFKHWDVVSLDHDLNDDENGEVAASFIANLPKTKRPSRCIIHSMNHEGAEVMFNILVRAGVNASIEPLEHLGEINAQL